MSRRGQGAEPLRARREAHAGKAVSHRRQVGWRIYVSCHFCRRGFLGGEPPQARRGARAGEYLGYSCTIVSVSAAGDFSAVSHRRQVGWRIYVSCHFCRRGFLGGEPPQASRLAHICVVPFLPHGDFSTTLETTLCSFDFIRLFAITTLLALEMASVYGYV